jgi:hypothetical protein
MRRDPGWSKAGAFIWKQTQGSPMFGAQGSTDLGEQGEIRVNE